MLKWIGAILIVSGAGLAGLDTYANQKKSLKLTDSFLKVLIYMKDEMQYSKAYIDSVFEKCVHISDETASFFEKIVAGLQQDSSLNALWDKTLDATENLYPPVREKLSELGAVLGTVDLDAQMHLLSHTVAQMENIKNEQEKELKSKGTLYPKIGFSAGALLAILLF